MRRSPVKSTHRRMTAAQFAQPPFPAWTARLPSISVTCFTPAPRVTPDSSEGAVMTPLATSRADGLRRTATATGATLAVAAVAVTATGTAAHADEQVTVRSGDTVSHIAARHGSTVTAVRQANG